MQQPKRFSFSKTNHTAAKTFFLFKDKSCRNETIFPFQGLKNRKDRLRYKKRKKFKSKNQKIQRANEMILNKSTITLSDDDKLFLIQGLNFAPIPSWNSKTETTE